MADHQRVKRGSPIDLDQWEMIISPDNPELCARRQRLRLVELQIDAGKALQIRIMMSEAVLSRLEQRLGRLHARQRLGIETDHEAQVTVTAPGFLFALLRPEMVSDCARLC